jgi:hypothetical protein
MVAEAKTVDHDALKVDVKATSHAKLQDDKSHDNKVDGFNSPLFYGMIGGVILLAGCGVFLYLKFKPF